MFDLGELETLCPDDEETFSEEFDEKNDIEDRSYASRALEAPPISSATMAKVKKSLRAETKEFKKFGSKSTKLQPVMIFIVSFSLGTISTL